MTARRTAAQLQRHRLARTSILAAGAATLLACCYVWNGWHGFAGLAFVFYAAAVLGLCLCNAVEPSPPRSTVRRPTTTGDRE